MALKKNENKVKFGLKRVAFAIATIAEDGSATYGDVISFPGARTLSMEPQGAGEPWYADDGVYYFSSAPTSRQGDLEMARIIDAFKREVLGYISDANGMMLEDMNPAEVHFALMFETMNDKRPRRYVLYNCMATAPTVGSATNEGSKEPQTETSTITSTGIYVPSQGKWFDHGETTPNTDMETYANWFNSVQVPGDPEGPYPIRHKKGNPVVITDAAGNMDIEELTATIKSAQDGSGTPTPANVRSIVGKTGMSIDVNNSIVPVSWATEAGTVYGGMVDVISGLLTVTHALVTIDGTNTIYTEKGSSTTRDVFYIGLPDASIFDGVARYLSVAECAAAGMLCSIAPFAESTDRSLPYLATAYIGREGAMLQLRLSVALSEGLSTVEAVNQFASTLYAAGTPIQYTYPLKEPVTYNLTPTQIMTLQGTNIISADVGTLKVAYHQDPALVE